MPTLRSGDSCLSLVEDFGLPVLFYSSTCWEAAEYGYKNVNAKTIDYFH